MSRQCAVPQASLVLGLLLVAGSLACYAVVYPRPDTVDGANPIVLVWASWLLAALGGVRLGGVLAHLLDSDSRVVRFGTTVTAVVVVAGVTQGWGWFLDSAFFIGGVFWSYAGSVLFVGTAVAVLREMTDLLVGALRRRGNGTDADARSHD